ncbi:MAG: hypothetical protein QMB22_04090 [Dehalococcoidia bacterium]|jgi:hypothetical protein|nr:MAG: hypothetical protein DK305_000088 [Chloroflexota bacterium]
MEDKIINLTELELPMQMQKMQELLKNTEKNFKYEIITQHEIIMKFIVPLAAGAGMKCAFAPPVDNLWKISITNN